MSSPATVTAPELGVTMPQTMLMSVVLPAPLGPSNAKISPLRISRLLSRSATNPDAYVLKRCETEMMGVMLPLGSARFGRSSLFGRAAGKPLLQVLGECAGAFGRALPCRMRLGRGAFLLQWCGGAFFRLVVV